ncbi:MAG: DEAD/DEAH box helicase family protein [archaeon]|nr:DEAD/DEAH box helicase family protein [archaeon]
MEYLNLPGIVPDRIEKRRYQMNIAAACMRANTLVILPTGLGKTAVALIVSVDSLNKGKKVLIMAPTKPLVDQHSTFFTDILTNHKVAVMNGHMSPAKRALAMSENDLIVSTPQSVANDLENGLYSLDGFGLVIYDEAHRGVGNYAYVTVAKYIPKGTTSMGMTASPGSDIKKVEEMCDNLDIARIEVRSDDDPDVSPYVFDTYVNRIVVKMPKELIDISDSLRRIVDRYFGELMSMRFATPGWPPSVKHMLSIGSQLQMRLARGEKTFNVYRGLTAQSVCIKVLHAITLVETQGMSALRAYMRRLNETAETEEATRADKELVKTQEYLDIWNIVRDSRIEHPKISRIMGLVSQMLYDNPNSKMIVFTQYRESCDILVEKLSKVESAKVCKLIGQSKGGLKQKEQVGILDDFREGLYNVLVCTSVGEEGLDISSTNAVIFYEPVSSEIRTIQRRGRTGRKNDGEVYVLIAGGTMDEAVDCSSKKKETMMRSRLETLGHDLSKRRNLSTYQLGIDYF